MIKKTALLNSLVEEFSLNMVFVALFSLLAMKGFCEGYCTSLSTLTSPFLESSLNRPTVNIMVRSSFFVGSLFSHIPIEIWKNSSQRNLMIGLSFLSVSTSIFYLFSASVVVISFSNFMLGFCCGAMIVVSSTMAVDLVRSKVRPVLFTWVWVSYPIGGVIAALVCKANNLLEHPENISQATFVLLCMGIGMSMFSFMLKDSPKYFLAEDRQDEALEVLEYMLGNKKYLLSEEVVMELKHKEKTAAEKAKLEPIDWWRVIRFSLPTFFSFGLFASIITYIPLVSTENETLSKPDRMIRNILTLVSFCFPADITSGILPSIKCIGRLGFVYVFLFISFGLVFLALFVPWKLILLSIAFGCCAVSSGVEVLIASEKAQPEHRNTTVSVVCIFGRLAKVIFIAAVEGVIAINKEAGLVFICIGMAVTLGSVSIIPK